MSVNFSASQQAGSVEASCPLQQNDDPCDPDGIKLSFKGGGESKSVECDLPRSQRDIAGYLSKLPVSDSEKYLLVNDYDCILEAIAEPSSGKKPGIFSPEPIFGEGPCDDHLGIDLTPKNTDSYDELKTALTNVTQCKGYQMWSKTSLVDTNLSHTMGFIGLFLMFDDTKAEKYVKEVEVYYQGCGIRHDGKQPKKEFRGLLRIYRNDQYAWKLSIPSRNKKGIGGSKSKDFSGNKESESRSYAGGMETTKTYDAEGSLAKEKTKGVGFFSNTESVKGEKPKATANEQGFVLTRSGHELDFTKKFNDILEIRDWGLNGIDLVKDIKDSIPKAGISGDISVEFLFGSLEANWGYSSGSKWDEQEYVWIEPKFAGTVSITIIKISGEVKAGIETISPSILNWWGRKAWEFELSITIGFGADLSIDASIERPSEEAFPTQDVIPGCEYQGKDGKEQKVISVQSTINPIFKGVAKVNLLGVGAEATIELDGGIEAHATVCWPFDVRYKGVLRAGRLLLRYTAGAKEPSPPHEIPCWDENENFIKENYLVGGKK